VLRNGPDGYGWLTKVLHWATVLALVAQFAIGYLMDADDGGRGRGRGRGRGGDSGRGRGHGGDSDGYDVLDDRLLTLHVLLGVLIIVLALVRLAWRRLDCLPPWADALTPRDRVIAKWTEKALLGLLVVIPATGLLLVLSGDDDLLWLHVAAHVTFFVALAVHVGLTLSRRLLPRML
jgi:cytochrome b561